MHIQHRIFSILNEGEHWKLFVLWIDNYMYMSSFNNSFMLLITFVSLLILPLKQASVHSWEQQKKKVYPNDYGRG